MHGQSVTIHGCAWLSIAASTFNLGDIIICADHYEVSKSCASQCDALKAEGADVASNPAAVIAKCDVTYAMLADPDAALAVANGPDGVAAGMEANPGKAYVDVSTVDEKTSQEIAKAVTSNGGRFLEVRVYPQNGCNTCNILHSRPLDQTSTFHCCCCILCRVP